MKYIITIFLLMACSSHQLTIKEKAMIRWSILEKAIMEKWTSKKIAEILGKPKEVRSNTGSESWYYESVENGYQEWSIGIRQNRVTGLMFHPTGSMDAEFTLDKILKRWEKYNCVNRKSDWYTKGHTVYQDTYYLCDGHKRIDYNRYGEVSWIKISEK